MTVIISGTQGTSTPGLYSNSTFTGTYADGAVLDYTTGLGRISVGTSDGIAFYNGGVATTELMRLDAAGALGIGYTTPSTLAALAVKDIGTTGTLALLSSTASNTIYIKNTGTSADFKYNDAYPMTWSINGTERMRLDASGNLTLASGSLSLSGSAPYIQVSSNKYFGVGSSLSGAYASTDLAVWNGASGNLAFLTNATERARIDSSGNLTMRVGNLGTITNSPTTFVGFYGAQSNGQAATFGTIYGISPGSWGGALVFTTKSADSNPGDTQVERARIDSSGNLLVGTTTAQEKLTVNGFANFNGSIYTLTDNSYSCGVSSRRWSVVYAATGTINTSDAREKTAIVSLNQSEINAAKQLAAEIGSYKWLAAIEEKGDAARAHIGMTVQRAIEIMEANGLVPFNYGFICYDEWQDKFVKDEDGNDVLDVSAGNRFSFRMDELSLFIARGQQQTIQEQQAIIEALRADVEQLKGKV